MLVLVRQRTAEGGSSSRAERRHLLALVNMSGPYFEVEKILKRRIKMGRVQYFLKWKGFPDTDNSWEPESNVTKDLITEFEKTFPASPAASRTSSARKRSPNRSSVALSPPIRKPVCRRTTSAPLTTTQVTAEPLDSEVKDEDCVSEEATDEELAFAASVYRDLVPDKVTGAVRLTNNLYLRTKWTDGSEDLVPAKYANRLFSDKVIAYYEANIHLHDLKPPE